MRKISTFVQQSTLVNLDEEVEDKISDAAESENRRDIKMDEIYEKSK